MEASRPSELLCDRTRSYVSLEVDGELSELERGFLVAHLRRCGDCRSYRSEIHALAGRIRSTPPEVPTRRVRVPVHVSSRPTVLLARVQLAVAAALAIAIVGTASLTSSIDPATPDSQETVQTSPTTPDVVFTGSGFPSHRVIPRSRPVTGPTTGYDFPV